MTRATVPPGSRWQRPAAALGLLVITLLTYLPAFRGGFVWDDDDYVTENPALRSLDGLRRIWFERGATTQYYPLTYTTFWVEYRFWGLTPAGYHAVNIFLHGANAILFWTILRRLSLPGAWFAAALFAVHPVHVESVAWITERKNTLSGLLYLLAALAYLRVRPLTESPSPRARTPWVCYVLSLLAYVAALMAKTTTISLPAAILLIVWWKHRRLTVRDLGAVSPFFALALLCGLVTYVQESDLVRSIRHEYPFTPLERCLLAGRILCFYLGKLAWPADLNFVYPRWQISTAVWWQYLYPLAAVAVLAALWLARNRLGRGPLIALLYFAGTLFPVLGFMNYYYMRYTFVADHFQYLPSLSILALASAAATRLLQRLGPTWTRGGPAFAAMILGAMAWISARQTLIYRDIETLWRSVVARDPASWIGNYNLADHLIHTGRTAEAIPYLEQAARTRPDDVESWNNLAAAFLETGRLDDAFQTFQTGLQIDPNDAYIHANLGVLYSRHGEHDKAIRHYRRALEIDPELETVRRNLNILLQRQHSPASLPSSP